MCNKRNSRKVVIGNRIVKVDNCMKELIDFINAVPNRRTMACCCGHGKYNMSVVVEWGVKGYFVELFSGKSIPRKRRFYNKKDKQGYYYIKEVVQ